MLFQSRLSRFLLSTVLVCVVGCGTTQSAGERAAPYPYPTQPASGRWSVEFECPYGQADAVLTTDNRQTASFRSIRSFGARLSAAELTRASAPLVGKRFYGYVSARCEPTEVTIQVEVLDVRGGFARDRIVEVRTARGRLVDVTERDVLLPQVVAG